MPNFHSRISRFALTLYTFGILALPPGTTAQEKPPPIAEKLDRYGDPLPPGAMVRLGTVRFRPASNVRALALSPDGKTLASAEYGEVALWELATGKKRARFVSDQRISLLAFAENGKTLITVDRSAILRYRDVATSKIVYECPLVEDVKKWDNVASITRDGRFLAFPHTTANTVCVWDLAARKEVKRLKLANDFEGGRVAISDDGKTLAAGSEGIEVLNVSSGKQVQALHSKPLVLHQMAFSPDGKTLFSAESYPHGTSRWDLSNGKLRKKWEFTPCEFSAFAISNDGNLLATLRDDDDYSLCIWDIAADKELRRWTIKPRSIKTLVFSSDSKMLISAGDENVIRLWDVAGGKEIKEFQEAEGSPIQLTASADGRWLAAPSRSDRTLLWDLKSHAQVARFAEASWYGKSVFSPDSKQIAYTHADHSVRLCEAATGKELRAFDRHEKEVCALAFDLDGKTLLTSDEDVTLRVRRVADGKELRRLALEAPPKKEESSMRYHYFSQDGRVLLTKFHDSEKSYRTWDTTNGRRVGPTAKRTQELVMAPDGRSFAAADKTEALSIYEIATGKRRLTLREADKEQGNYGMPMAYSPDGRILAADSADRKTIDFWDLASGQCIHRIKQVQGGLSGITFVGNGDLLATGGHDTTILLWDVTAVRAKMKILPLAITTAEFDKLWQQLGSDDPHTAIWKLVAGGDASVQFLRKQVRPVVGPTAPELEKWIGQLQDDKFALREIAMQKLEKTGEWSEPALRAALAKQPPLEAKRRIEVLLEKILAAAATGYTPERVREMRALETLENIGSPSAKAFLSELAEKAPGTWLSKEAHASLHRLQNRAETTVSRERPSSVP